jgi:multidrug efflux system membrane fusion protein
MSGSKGTAARAAACGALAGLVAVAVGCGGSPSGAKADLPPPIVTVAPPVERPVTRYEYATGRAAPLEQVEVRSQVNGFLKAIKFEPGKDVAKDQPLFEIDPELYKADLAHAKAIEETAVADLATSEAELTRAEVAQTTAKLEYDRQETAFKGGGGSATDRDKAKGQYDGSVATVKSNASKIKLAKANIEKAKADVRTAELNLGYCSITSPINGVVGDKLVTEGNLVTAKTTLLTTVVAVEKMDVAFDVDENTLQRIQQSVREGKLKQVAANEIPVEAGLSVHGTAYPLKGSINFVNNQLDPKTGTIRFKARFENAKPAAGQRLFSAGMFVRVRVPVGEPVKSMLVPDSAFGSDQGSRFLYVIGPDNKALRLDAATGAVEGDLRVVEAVSVPGEGKARPLAPADRVIVNGVQRVRPGMVVDPKPAQP